MREVVCRTSLRSGIAQEPRNTLCLEKFSEIIVFNYLEDSGHFDRFFALVFFYFVILKFCLILLLI